MSAQPIHNSSGTSMPWRIIGGLGVLVVIVIALLLLIGPHKKTNINGDKLHVVAAENFWGNIAGQIGGSHVAVTSIITDPEADPHLYESSAQNAAQVSTADVIIMNGVGYDGFMSKLLNASPNKDRQVLTAADILGVRGNDANPHLWYDIPRVHVVAGQIAASFEAKDPAHKDDYEHNLTVFDNSLQPLIATINQIKQQHPGAPVAYTERVPGYLLADAGLTVKTPASFAAAIEDDTDPSPADTQTMSNLMTNKGVKVLLYNSQATSPVTQHIQDLANQAGVPVVGVTETLPAGEKTYQAWQQDQLDALLKALQTR